MSLKIPKRRVVVEIASAVRAARPMELFVDEHLDGAAGREGLLGHLEDAQRFVPVRDPGDGTFALVNKDRVRWVAVPLEALDEQSPLYDLRCEVRVELEGGEHLEGRVLYCAPAEQARLSDFLNRGDRFFRLFGERQVLLVNRSFVVRVVELPVPAPTAARRRS